jgi:hypothetical protein
VHVHVHVRGGGGGLVVHVHVRLRKPQNTEHIAKTRAIKAQDQGPLPCSTRNIVALLSP